ncbi:PQQ-dependent sugar dehydrogenase [Ferrimonas balearica]|uniref:PQQ-dependent sugar dehydrogenase n=1 Tax=Ferrimonas balearica TaxID=44012 RepID=UPI001F2F1F8F|nr:PQQ-dependent sugar dehydrogenase [Ferrimonas balearica]MBY6094316.1 PQQ-dependent sugar dehydrogenase [Ferrimonas balearica]
MTLGRILIISLAMLAPAVFADPALTQARLPEGFKLELYLDGVENARQMAWGDQGTLFVGSRKAGKVHAVTDSDGDGEPDQVRVLADGLFLPSGIAFRDGNLYVAAVSQVLVYRDVESRLTNPGEPEVLVDDLPSDAHHGWKYLDFAPDGRLVVPVGAPCNICNPEEPYATILAIDLDKGRREVLARGVRNSVGFDFHPQTGQLWFSDNGRDHMGDDLPPDEINRLEKVGDHFGYPYWHGGEVADPEYVAPEAMKARFIDPVARLQAHVAPLGVHFYQGEQFPARYRNALFIAEHGSWNRSSKVGYLISALIPGDGDNGGYEVVVDGWLDGQTPLVRPVAFLPHPDGSLLISDDYKGRIYRLSYNPGDAGK